jgi:hypothetical protein
MGTRLNDDIVLTGPTRRGCQALSVFGVAALLATALLAYSGPAAAAERNPVTEWVSIVQPAIHSPAEPRPPVSAELIHTIVHLAVYDAVVAIKGG